MSTTPEVTAVPADHWLSRWWQAWDRFWFRPADPTPLALIRICCGLITLYVHLAYSYDLQEFFGKHAWYDLQTANLFRKEAPWIAPSQDWDPPKLNTSLPDDPEKRAEVVRYIREWGVHPDQAVAKGNYMWSIWYHVTDPVGMAVVHGGVLLVMVLFTIGFCTRITSVLTWLGALSYIQRSPMTLFGMDTIMIILLLYLMIGPSGAALSVDRWIVCNRARRRGQAEVGFLRPEPMVSANLALRLMQVHFCFVYLASGLSKLLGDAWWNGTAVWLTLGNYEFTPLRFQIYADFLRWLCKHRWLWEIVMTAGTAYTLVVEIGLPFLIWLPRWRWLMLVGAVLLHTGIGFTMGLVGFSLFMLTMVLAFVPAEAIHRVIERASRRLIAAATAPRDPGQAQEQAA